MGDIDIHGAPMSMEAECGGIDVADVQYHGSMLVRQTGGSWRAADSPR